MGFGAGREAMQAWLARPTWISAQPRWAQLVLALLFGDLLGYVAHRLFHRGRAWRFHAVHHSSPGLDWLSSVRLHPLNEVGSRLLVVVPLALLGFKPLQMAAVPVATALYALLLHADVSWDFGPLRGVLASPAFHRWHHAAGPAARDRNFAGLFAFWDVLFGTYHLPRGARPERLGVDEAVPRGVLAQLVWPFRSGASNANDQVSKDDPHVPRARRSDAGRSPASAVR